MINQTIIKSSLEEMGTLELVTQAFGQIASSRMKQIRDSVLSSREFIESLDDVFDDIRRGYERKRQNVFVFRRKKQDQVTFLSHNGRSVALFLSANTGLYGEIVAETFAQFLTLVSKGNHEVVIVGRQGLASFLGSELDIPYTYFDLPDHSYTPDHLAKIIRHIVRYDEISVFFGRFESVLSQHPEKKVISSAIDLEKKTDGVQAKDYYFDPSIEMLLEFFEVEMFTEIFEQLVRESQLAKFASRIIAMDRANENIASRKKTLSFLYSSSKHREMNKKQLNRLSSIMDI